MERREKKQPEEEEKVAVCFNEVQRKNSITDYKSVTLFSQKAMIIYNVNKRILYCLCFISY